MENLEIIEVLVKVIALGEFNDFESWIKNTQECAHIHGVNSKLLHIDKKGYSTTGYIMKNLSHNEVYPVKTYLLVQSPDLEKPLPFKSSSKN